jgi:DNA repair exonuclease SbcCD ATPase subunit
VSQPSNEAGDTAPQPAETKNIDTTLPPEGQAVGQGSPSSGPAGGDLSPAGTGANPAGGDQAGQEEPDECATECTSIDEEIECLKSHVVGKRDTRDAAENEYQALQNRLKALEDVQRDLEATLKAYEPAYEQLAREDRAYKDYLDCERGSLEDLLGTNGIETVGKLVSARSSTSESLKKKVDDFRTALDTAESEREARKGEVKQRRDELNEWKKLTSTITARHAQLKSMRDEVTKAHQAGYYGLAYWLFTLVEEKYHEFVGDPRLVDPEDVPQALRTAVQGLAEAEKCHSMAERRAKAAKDDLTSATGELDQHNKGSEAKLREDLQQIPAAQSPGGDPDQSATGRDQQDTSTAAKRPDDHERTQGTDSATIGDDSNA